MCSFFMCLFKSFYKPYDFSQWSHLQGLLRVAPPSRLKASFSFLVWTDFVWECLPELLMMLSFTVGAADTFVRSFAKIDLAPLTRLSGRLMRSVNRRFLGHSGSAGHAAHMDRRSFRWRARWCSGLVSVGALAKVDFWEWGMVYIVVVCSN